MTIIISIIIIIIMTNIIMTIMTIILIMTNIIIMLCLGDQLSGELGANTTSCLWIVHQCHTVCGT